MLFHLSVNYGLEYLTPQIPECAVLAYEDTNTPRICFSDSIEGCLSALQDIPRIYYVYIIDEHIDDDEIYHPSVKEVADAKINNEVWILREVKVKCIGKIKSNEYDFTSRHNTGIGRRVTFFHYPYHWIERYVGLY